MSDLKIFTDNIEPEARNAWIFYKMMLQYPCGGNIA